jgi:hypothetical protein
MQDESAMVPRVSPSERPSSSRIITHTTQQKQRQLSVVEEEEGDLFFLSEFLYFCSNKFCFGNDSNIKADNEADPASHDDSRNSITQSKRRSSDWDNNTRSRNDDSWSCDSTLASSGIISHDSSQQKYRFFVDRKMSMCPDDASVATLLSADDRTLFLKDPWDAHYTSNAKPTMPRPLDARSNKTEGAKPSNHNTSLWNLSILENTPNCSSFDSRVLATSTADDSTKPIVLTASIMDSLQRHLPYSKQGEMFWLKYSMVRDGANLNTVLNKTKVCARFTRLG